eukprot:542248-Prymnesium_polylepis.1
MSAHAKQGPHVPIMFPYVCALMTGASESGSPCECAASRDPVRVDHPASVRRVATPCLSVSGVGNVCWLQSEDDMHMYMCMHMHIDHSV